MDNGHYRMRDVIIEAIHSHMISNDRIFFITADFGSPKLDSLKNDFSNRFINVGIAEQNLINISFGWILQDTVGAEAVGFPDGNMCDSSAAAG